MRAVVYEGPRHMRVANVPDPRNVMGHEFVGELPDHIQAGRLHPELVISHRLPLEEAPRAYKIFAEKQEECRKVVLYPWGVPNAA